MIYMFNHTSLLNKNQELNLNNQNGFFSSRVTFFDNNQNSEVDKFILNPAKYLEQLDQDTCETKVLKFILERRRLDDLWLSNAYIRSKIKKLNGEYYTFRQIRRATSNLQGKGFFNKVQISYDNYSSKYGFNTYQLDPRIKTGKTSFNLFINSLNEQQKDSYFTCGKINIELRSNSFQSGDVLHIKNSLSSLDLYINNPTPTPSKEGFKKRLPKNIWLKENNLKRANMLMRKQKQLIIENKNHPDMKEILNNPKIKSLIITPFMELIQEKLMFNDYELLKLIAFPEQALKYVFDCAIKQFDAPGRAIIHNKIAWFVKMCTKYCKANDLKPDWFWYYTFCEIMGVDPNVEGKKAPPSLATGEGHNQQKLDIKNLNSFQGETPLTDKKLQISAKNHGSANSSLLTNRTMSDNVYYVITNSNLQNSHKNQSISNSIITKSYNKNQQVNELTGKLPIYQHKEAKPSLPIHEEIALIEQYMNDPKNKPTFAFLGLVVIKDEWVDLILSDKITSQERERLLSTYPLLDKKTEIVINKQSYFKKGNNYA